jgi:hypothetical protein
MEEAQMPLRQALEVVRLAGAIALRTRKGEAPRGGPPGDDRWAASRHPDAKRRCRFQQVALSPCNVVEPQDKLSPIVIGALYEVAQAGE